MLEFYIRESLLLVLVFSGIPLLLSTIVGLGVAILQGATQVQEQTISYVARVSVAVLTLAWLSPWFYSRVVLYVQEVLRSIQHLGNM